MAPDEIESRLRRSLAEASADWQPSGPAAADIVDGVRRRRAQRRRTAAMTGCAAVVVLALGVGAYSLAGSTGTPGVSGVKALAPPTSTGAPAASGGAVRLGPSPPPAEAPANAAAASCASVTVGSGVPQCAGIIHAPSSVQGTFGVNSAPGVAGAPATTTSIAPSPANVPPPSPPASPTPISVTVRVGQRLAVTLPMTAGGSWGTPVAVPASDLATGTQEEFGGHDALARPGAVRVVRPAHRRRGTRATTVFEAVRPGPVVLSATVRSTCTGDVTRAPGAPSCAVGPTSWTLLVLVTAR
jgi:hypothetical protein